jgi:NAD(P)H dehydrogenase (quinone)
MSTKLTKPTKPTKPAVNRPLVVIAAPPGDEYSTALAQAVLRGLSTNGRTVASIDLYTEGFRAAMSREERLAYETTEPILDPVVERYANMLRGADALVFVYPSWGCAQPAILKGWVERVLVPGVGFSIDPTTNRVVGGLGHIKRLVGVTTYPETHAQVLVIGDAGRRLTTRCLRMMSPRIGRSARWFSLYGRGAAEDAAAVAFLGRVEASMRTL